MHGRVKTKSTEEQKIQAQKEKEEKKELYLAAMKRICEKRSLKEYDDEALALTGEVLMKNPDVVTLWNYRREVYLERLKTLLGEEADKALKSELSLTDCCLRVNPKSYGTWHYRIWILDNFPNSDWNNELYLCNKYLMLDERNFHCWNYRQIIVERAQVPAIDEYNFTTSKIESNFSNYSAWHYRSKLLPKLFKDPQGIFPIAEEKQQSELELVQNAAFTDPDDQSAWFYQRWLLGLRNPPASFICGQIKEDIIFVALSQEICVLNGNSLKAEINGEKMEGQWLSASGEAYSPIWLFNLTTKMADDDVVLITLVMSEKDVDVMEVRKGEATKRPISFAPANTAELMKTLEEQRVSCEELLELEPDSKWTMLTGIFLMRSLDATLYHSKILKSLETLSQIDPYRSGYYSDLLSRIQIEYELTQSGFKDEFDFSSKNLKSLYHSQYLMLAKTIDLSNNKLNKNVIAQFNYLINCKNLNLSGNNLPATSLSKQTCIENVQV